MVQLGLWVDMQVTYGPEFNLAILLPEKVQRLEQHLLAMPQANIVTVGVRSANIMPSIRGMLWDF
jgi:hypothetical protein